MDSDSIEMNMCLCSSKTSYRNQFVGQMWCVGHSLVSPGMVNKNHPQSSYQNVNILLSFLFSIHIDLYGCDYVLYCTKLIP